MRCRLRALVFDLDDTLIRTYEDLIVPLEGRAARLMLEVQDHSGSPSVDRQGQDPLPSPEALAELLLRCRRRDPEALAETLADRFPGLASEAWKAREEIFRNPSVSGLTRMPGARRLLEALRLDYRLFLLTHGDLDYQRRKLEKSGLKPFFDGVRIVERGREKRAVLEALVSDLRLQPQEMGVIGNRLDVEIRMGCEMGCATIWMRHGEGSEMPAERHKARSDHVIEKLQDLADLLS